jgi:hypothetical protein
LQNSTNKTLIQKMKGIMTILQVLGPKETEGK